ncbi:STAS domain-containing protein [Streptomyces sp. BV286]|uniref:STAS domain-containing protein n=1 Tax=unclassified Streptomyces TaxID=2593676 RepID=UPI001C2E1F9D|nr:STAS domain-containing protein [Streptomyces sp. BV286]MBV1938586.1 STAS domain-containing protein [Streptomyces sp. BV286]
MTQHLSLHIRTAPAGAVIEIAGDLDHHTAPEVRAALPGLDLLPGQQLVLDLGGITFCDSSGITALIAARNHALACDAGIALAAIPDRVSRIFRIVGLDQVFPSHLTVQAAQAEWRPATS